MKRILLIIFFFLLFYYPLHSEQKSESQNFKVDPLAVNPKDYIQENVEIDSLVYANITNDSFRDVIVTGTFFQTINSYDERCGYAAIISYDRKERKWKLIYDKIKAYAYFHVLTGKIFPNKTKDVVIFFDWHGNGRFMDYIVVGYLENKIKILLQNSDIYRGDLEIEDNQIIEYEGYQATAHKWVGTSFQRLPLPKTPLKSYTPGDKIIEFSIDDQENVSLSDKEITLRVGQTFHLVRTNHGVPENIFGTSDGVLSDSGWIAQRPGTTFIEIVPWGSNWGKKGVITIHVIDTTTADTEKK